MIDLINNALVMIGFYSISYREENTIEKTGSGDYDYEFVGTGKIVKEYERTIFKTKLPF
tara:strand:- start:1368 stop:1544 length:177 start_codon:yes stop_codon:yes gene_type:complete